MIITIFKKTQNIYNLSINFEAAIGIYKNLSNKKSKKRRNKK